MVTGVKLLIVSIFVFTLMACVTLGKTKIQYESEEGMIRQEILF